MNMSNQNKLIWPAYAVEFKQDAAKLINEKTNRWVNCIFAQDF